MKNDNILYTEINYEGPESVGIIRINHIGNYEKYINKVLKKLQIKKYLIESLKECEDNG